MTGPPKITEQPPGYIWRKCALAHTNTHIHRTRMRSYCFVLIVANATDSIRVWESCVRETAADVMMAEVGSFVCVCVCMPATERCHRNIVHRPCYHNKMKPIKSGDVAMCRLFAVLNSFSFFTMLPRLMPSPGVDSCHHVCVCAVHDDGGKWCGTHSTLPSVLERIGTVSGDNVRFFRSLLLFRFFFLRLFRASWRKTVSTDCAVVCASHSYYRKHNPEIHNR